MTPSEAAHEPLAILRARLAGRAVGAWRVESDRLEQVAFEAAPDMPFAVVEGFRSATRSVDPTRLNLGIVQALASKEVVVSIARDLPPESGSGYWLRAFDAARSVAVPILDRDGRVTFVVSIALGLEPGVEHVASAIQGQSGSAWQDRHRGLDSPNLPRDNRDR